MTTLDEKEYDSPVWQRIRDMSKKAAFEEPEELEEIEWCPTCGRPSGIPWDPSDYTRT